MKVRYVVSQIDWAKGGYGTEPYLRRTPRTTPVADFKTSDAAEFDRRRREEDARAGANPFHYGGESLFYQSDFAAPYLHDWLMDAAIEPPENPQGHGDWVAWWDRCSHAWSAAQQEHAWAAMHKVRFFEITESHPARKAYVVVEVNWTWHDEPTLQADHEGGNVVRAYRSKATADAECARLNRERQQQPTRRAPVVHAPVSRRRFQPVANRHRRNGVLRSGGNRVGGRGMSAPTYLVVRRAFERDGTPCGTQDGDDTGSRVPLRLFTSRAAAEAHAAELARAVRRTVNPFHLLGGTPSKAMRTAIAALDLPLLVAEMRWYDEWAAWWDTIQEALSDEQRASVWAVFGPTYPFEVCEVEVE